VRAVLTEKDLDAGVDPVPPVDVSEDDPAVIVYTSGSTGKPHGAVLRHGNILANTRSIVRYLELHREDRAVVVLPFPYVYGASLLHTHVAVGGSLVLHGSTVFPNKILDAIAENEATGFAGVPSTFAILLHRSDIASRRFPTLRYVTQAGGPMPPAHVRRLVEALPGTRVIVMYGATEASARLTWLPPEHLERKLGSIGVPIPDVELRIRREDGSEAATDEVGEIVARGPNIMAGYWGDPAGTAEVLDGAGFHTGDLGRRDADGFFWVVGRRREMIKSGAHRISPREIEDVLLLDPAVEEAAVVGRPDEVLGEVVIAHVTARPGKHPSSEGLKRLCQERLPAAKVPVEVHVRESMPRNAAGKVDKLALRATASAG
jgi:acyl-CoA synthetase (AMP-forming)/AMP-acid ligase II